MPLGWDKLRLSVCKVYLARYRSSSTDIMSASLNAPKALAVEIAELDTKLVTAKKSNTLSLPHMFVNVLRSSSFCFRLEAKKFRLIRSISDSNQPLRTSQGLEQPVLRNYSDFFVPTNSVSFIGG